MNRIFLIAMSCLLLFAQRPGFGQKKRMAEILEKVPQGISWETWEKMNQRWQSYSTRVSILKTDGTIIEGQLTWMSDSILLVQRNFDLPNGLMNPEDFSRIPVGTIASMEVRYGGHPYQGLIIGLLAGVIPGFITGAILAQGWTIIPAIVFGAVTAAGGGVAGSFIQKGARKQTIEINAKSLTGKKFLNLKNSALFPESLPKLPTRAGEATLPDFENLVNLSETLDRAFPDNPFAISLHSTLMTNSVRKRMQNWYTSPYWGPPSKYYEMRIGLQGDLSRRIGKRFQAGMLFQFFPGDISSSFFDNYGTDMNVDYSYNHHFNQTTFGIYGGWLLHPIDAYRATRLEASIQAGPVVSDVYEHFYFSWNTRAGEPAGHTFIQEHNLQPGVMLRIKSSWYLIPGFSIDSGIEGFWIKRVLFPERTLLPETAYGPLYIPYHKLNFSNLQAFIGLSVHF